MTWTGFRTGRKRRARRTRTAERGACAGAAGTEKTEENGAGGLTKPPPDPMMLQEAAGWHRSGTRSRRAPREAGAKMVLLEDGYTTAGTIGGGCVEADALLKARRMLQAADSRPELLHVNMTAEEAEEEGMVCGGTVDILLDAGMIRRPVLS